MFDTNRVREEVKDLDIDELLLFAGIIKDELVRRNAGNAWNAVR